MGPDVTDEQRRYVAERILGGVACMLGVGLLALVVIDPAIVMVLGVVTGVFALFYAVTWALVEVTDHNDRPTQ